MAAGLVGQTAFVGFGSSAPGTSMLVSPINLTGTALGEVLNFAYSVPRDGVITNITAFFSIVSATGLGSGDYYARCILYRSDNPADNSFDQIAASGVALTPSFTSSSISFGNVARGSRDVNIPVSAGDRLLLVFFFSAPFLASATSVIGYANASITIV